MSQATKAIMYLMAISFTTIILFAVTVLLSKQIIRAYYAIFAKNEIAKAVEIMRTVPNVDDRVERYLNEKKFNTTIIEIASQKYVKGVKNGSEQIRKTNREGDKGISGRESPGSGAASNSQDGDGFERFGSISNEPYKPTYGKSKYFN